MVLWSVWIVAASPAAPTCAALVERLESLSPGLRRGRVQVAGCARAPGERAVVVLAAPAGGDPIDLSGLRGGARARGIEAAWPSEPVVLVADRGDPAQLVRDVIAPVRAAAVIERPGELGVDVIVAEPGPPDHAAWVRLASAAVGRDVRVFTDGSWSSACARARIALRDALPLSDDDVERLVGVGVLGSDDVAALPADALAGIVGGDPGRARALADAAAWLGEFAASPDGRRRGW